MRNKNLIAVHRGGLLQKTKHRLLMKWARTCAEHVMVLSKEKPLEFLHALNVSVEWESGFASVGEARDAAIDVLRIARKSRNPITIALARSLSHAVATAHMADHAMRASQYALKAVQLSGGSVEAEKEWQQAQLPEEVADLIVNL